MKTYCAFLRGVNVNGKTIKMVEACDVLKQVGFIGDAVKAPLLIRVSQKYSVVRI